ncbi:hybrid-cluster NAD(P)-dependent oxidoreductase [Amycolatopsis nigrescens]|uniref:hybrid-cluster NAD(P)-dependent oxidoreductase n=1 Tax=Amycolatopsis nigrescens TaxID=381445 RepID=UPI00036656F1|nr:hybrid-cluster NAD(P)-dependent oxidoreductase [Amycolatopsis nigrescens]
MNRSWADRLEWEGGVLVCKQIQDITADVKTFVLEPVEPRGFGHDPGQHLTITVDIDGREVDRCYTISSPPSRPQVAAITVKRVPDGVVSNWLHDHLAPGHALRARGPLGTFSMARHPAAKYLFLSGGSGITPLMSMTRTLHDLAHPADLVFVHSARTPEDIIFRRELECIAATSRHIRVVHVCERDGPPGERWGGYRGRLTQDVLRQIAPDFLQREVFTCGPPGYMSAVRSMLTEAGLPAERYHQESFTFDVPAGVESTVDTVDTGDARETFSVEFARTGQAIECGTDTPILEAASAAGLTLPSSCGQGMCGTCKTTLLKGSVDLRHNGGIRPREIAADKILLCCARPLENLVIDS